MENKNITIDVYGAGLAGCEAAWQIANRGIKVNLYEMKPHKFTPAHHSDSFAELVCSNSLRSDRVTNAVGLLKEELDRMGSLSERKEFEQTSSAKLSEWCAGVNLWGFIS